MEVDGFSFRMGLYMNATDLKCSTTGDIIIENGDLQLVAGVEELQQRLLTRLRWFYGEYQFDVTLGVRYFEDILVKNPNLPNIEVLLKNMIAETDGVNKITSFQFSYDPVRRSASVSFDVESIYGTIELDKITLGV